MEVGKLYQYTCMWNTGLNPQLHILYPKIPLRRGDIVILLEKGTEQGMVDSPAYKVLTTKGDIGWYTTYTGYLKPITSIEDIESFED